MAKHEMTFEILDEILDAADMYLSQPGDYDDGSDAVAVRPRYRGRGYVPEGFGLVVSGESAVRVLMAAAGQVEGQRRADGDPGFDLMAFARRAETDSMGRDSIIVYWPDWEVTGLPEIYTD
jgi:hypothetical protein